jgi:hypothetical protein
MPNDGGLEFEQQLPSIAVETSPPSKSLAR